MIKTTHLLDFDATSVFLDSGIFYSLEKETSADVSLTTVMQIIPKLQVGNELLSMPYPNNETAGSEQDSR